jgi:hypothetical protein
MPTIVEKTKPLYIGITGQTEFHLGNPDAPISVDISVGYRKTPTGDNKTESRLFASLASVKETGITVKDIISSATKNDEDIPDILDHVAFKKFSVSYGSGGLKASDLSINFDCIVTLNENTFDASILIEYKKDAHGNVAFTFKGILKVDTYRFELQFTKQENAWYVFANINAENIDIDLQKIAAKLFDEKTAKELPELQFTLSNFKAFLLFTKKANNARLLFGMGADLKLNLNKLPMAGSVLSQDDAFAFKEVLAIYSKGAFSEKELTSFDAIPKVEIATGFNITTELLINGKTDCYVLNSGTSPDNETPADTPPAKNTDVAPLNGDVSSKAKWKKLDKKIGPVSIQRIGFAYEKGKVVLLLDASMEMIGMGMQLMGFGLGFKLEWPPKIENTDFYLDGIGLSYKAPPIEISGAFLHSVYIVDGKPVDNYSGGAIIKVSKFTISAIGAYAKVDDEASLFIYGVYDGPIGGPVFFFVTGIAAGFGYNRKVNVPSINEVASYPLVVLAMQPETDGGLPQVLTSLETPMKNGKKPIEISVGDYWLAVGIKFTSFKIIESFVLLTVNFGTQLEFAILGLSRLVWPEKSVALEPIVYVELAILAHFGPGSDVISVEAVLTPNSYVLSKDCKLSGGFAFYTWVSGPYEGDFVVTLGGYHPKFVKPAHYPTVPRVALNWKIGKYVSIKGELYYALTPSAIMAGGKWEVSFKTSIIKASLVLWADMLIAWAPFQYIISVGIIIRIEATIKIAFIRVHFNFEMGAQLYIWGPPFAGKAHVDWSVFSFTIPFGDHNKQTPKPLQWHEFSKGFIPQGKSKNLLNSSGDVISNPDPINITISNGLIEVKQLEEQGTEIKFPIINPHQLAIIVDSFIPVTQLTHKGVKVDKETIMISETGNTIYDERNTAIGIRPCGFTADEVDFIMDVKMTLEGAPMTMKLVCNAKGMAEAMWGAKASENSNTNPGTAKIMTNVLTGVTLYPPVIKQVAQVRSFDFSKLIDRYKASFTWHFSQMQVASAYSSIDVLGYYNSRESKEVDGILKNTYTETEGKRKHITSLLQTVFDDLPDIEESEINNEIIIKRTTYYRGIPIVCELGQIPQYPTDVA